MPLVATFGENLKRLRLKAGISQEALAASAGLRRNGTVAGWEKRHTPPRPESVDKLARALGVSKADLLEGVPTGYEDEKQATLTSSGTVADDAGAAAEEAGLSMSEAKLRHIQMIRGLRDDVFTHIERELEQVIGRALAGAPQAEPLRAGRASRK